MIQTHNVHSIFLFHSNGRCHAKEHQNSIKCFSVSCCQWNEFCVCAKNTKFSLTTRRQWLSFPDYCFTMANVCTSQFAPTIVHTMTFNRRRFTLSFLFWICFWIKDFFLRSRVFVFCTWMETIVTHQCVDVFSINAIIIIATLYYCVPESTCSLHKSTTWQKSLVLNVKDPESTWSQRKAKCLKNMYLFIAFFFCNEQKQRIAKYEFKE